MCDPKRHLRPVKTCWCCDPQRHLRPKKIFATCKTFLVRTERTLIPCAELLRRGVHVRDFLFLIMLFYASILACHFLKYMHILCIFLFLLFIYRTCGFEAGRNWLYGSQALFGRCGGRFLESQLRPEWFSGKQLRQHQKVPATHKRHSRPVQDISDL